MLYIKGDLIEKAKNGDFDVIVHGCNCFNSMGAGIAATIRKDFPSAYEADRKTLKGDKKKIGTYTQATVKIKEQDLTIVNAYTQYQFWGDKDVDLVEYEGLQQILDKLKIEFTGKKIGFPLIGCGLANGDKDKIVDMIKNSLDGCEVTIVEWTKNYVPLYKKMK